MKLMHLRRLVYSIQNLPKEIIEMIKNAQMDDNHYHLNALLEEHSNDTKHIEKTEETSKETI